MTVCEITVCNRAAVVEVTFITGGTRRYCDYHGYRRGELRWDDEKIVAVKRLT